MIMVQFANGHKNSMHVIPVPKLPSQNSASEWWIVDPNLVALGGWPSKIRGTYSSNPKKYRSTKAPFVNQFSTVDHVV